jgi:Bacteriocin-protection, YdeI or OmpD-Associated/Domain of unknown function (DUF1905)
MILELTLEPITASNCAFVVPDADVAALGGGGRPKVNITANGVTWRTSIARMGGRYLLGLTKAQFAEAGVRVGDRYLVAIVLETDERVVEVPEDLARALASDERRQAAWEAWSYTRRKEAAVALTGAKLPSTRERRLAKILAELG